MQYLPLLLQQRSVFSAGTHNYPLYDTIHLPLVYLNALLALPNARTETLSTRSDKSRERFRNPILQLLLSIKPLELHMQDTRKSSDYQLSFPEVEVFSAEFFFVASFRQLYSSKAVSCPREGTSMW